MEKLLGLRLLDAKWEHLTVVRRALEMGVMMAVGLDLSTDMLRGGCLAWQLGVMLESLMVALLGKYALLAKLME